MVERAMHGPKQHVEEFVSRYNWLREQMELALQFHIFINFDNSSFYKTDKEEIEIEFKIEFLLPFTGSTKVLEK